VIEWVVYFSAYLFAGLTLKIGDDLLDELDRPDLSWIPLALAGVLFGFIMTVSEWDLVCCGICTNILSVDYFWTSTH